MNLCSEASLSAREIDAAQRAAWEKTFLHVAANSPFYRRHFAQAGIDCGKPLAIEDISRIPTIEKMDVSRDSTAFLCVAGEKVADVVTTSGSTGQPLVWMLTEADLERLALNEQLSFECAGFTSADTVLLAVAMDRCFIAGMAYFLGLRRLGCRIIRTGPGAPMQLDMLRRTHANAIVAVPSLLHQLALNASQAGLRPGDLGLKKAVCIGESLRNPDLTLNPFARNLSREWGVKLYSTYGVTELASSLCECDAGRGGHLHSALLHIECLDAKGNLVPDGEVGEITATTLGVEGMPLVRYRTGDCAALFRERCPCGRATLRMGPVLGRKNQKLKLKGTTLFPSTLKTILDSTPGALSHVILARRQSPTCDAIEVRVACEGEPARVLSALRERFLGEAKALPEIHPTTPEEIETLQFPAGARKRRYFIDLRDFH
jgi:phenylacetate-CoA ligase